jgi:hypothetical protein
MIVDMLGALTITKVPRCTRQRVASGTSFTEGRLRGLIFVLIVDAGGYSYDARINRAQAAPAVTSVPI